MFEVNVFVPVADGDESVFIIVHDAEELLALLFGDVD